MPQEFDPVAYINTPRWQASRLGLERITALLERMGRPQDDLRFVHVAGTNGKGSVCSYVASVLTCAGYRVGLFTSPYIEAFEERIRVDGANITRDDLARATLVVREHASALEAATGEHPTEFELMCAVALEHFRAARCDVVVLEVGLGGRLDSTNVIDAPEVSVICRVGLDHTALLGGTLAEVAGEKAGIIKPGVPVVSWPQEPEAAEVVERVVRERGCELFTPDFDQLEVLPLALPAKAAEAAEGARDSEAARGREVAGNAETLEGARGGEAAENAKDAEAADSAKGAEAAFANVSRETFVRHFQYKGVSYVTQLLGSYQPANAALAIEVADVLRRRGWHITPAALAEGIARTTWPGRFEVVARDPLTIVDGGHNPQGAEALAASLADLLGGADAARGRVTFAMGVLADKDYPTMIEAVAPFACAFVAYAPDNPRALPARDLAAAIEAACAPCECESGELDAPSPSATGMPGACAHCERETDALSVRPHVEAAESPAAALARARALAGADGVVVAFGTLYAVGAIKAAL
ncbi:MULTISPECIES: folylpolyglutamate synthase/dihydrofolate synthase family protein [unclassified Adlercreutzia]|uniref:bifunctional folylpolyglutamate synthase/dihydrofolate synthase n=1 Tax=unclassified Adlercreutzia TaxID=2636013 RepID=UPI001F155CA4|nr:MULTISPECIES: Mur ligase family protein [unclassified Adlercreutzia]